jgi:hypothetical protein
MEADTASNVIQAVAIPPDIFRALGMVNHDVLEE